MNDNHEPPMQDDAQLADELEKAMADPTEWGEPIRESRQRRSEKRQRAAMISIRLSAEELSVVQDAATARGLSVSRYVRDCALWTAPPKSTSLLGLELVTNRTSTDRLTSAGPLVEPIDVPTTTAASPLYLMTSESSEFVASSASAVW